MRLAAPVLAVGLFALVAGCAPQPMTAERAARLCEPEARAADGITGELRAGVSSGGPAGGGRIRVTSDILNPRPEADVRAECIARRMAGDDGPVRPRSGLTFAIEGEID